MRWMARMIQRRCGRSTAGRLGAGSRGGVGDAPEPAGSSKGVVGGNRHGFPRQLSSRSTVSRNPTASSPSRTSVASRFWIARSSLATRTSRCCRVTAAARQGAIANSIAFPNRASLAHGRNGGRNFRLMRGFSYALKTQTEQNVNVKRPRRLNPDPNPLLSVLPTGESARARAPDHLGKAASRHSGRA